MLLAFIPARGGSKGIPRKNLVPLGGRPLIEYSIEVAQRCPMVDEILLSTDDDEIAAVGRRMGLDVGYRRPPELGGDAVGMLDTIEHALRWVEAKRGRLPDEVVLLQPTSPFRSVEDVQGAVTTLRESGAPSVVSVHPMAEHPSECVSGSGTRWSFLAPPPPAAVRRQDYTQDFHYINGAVYVAAVKTLLTRRGFLFPGETALYVMSRDRGIDIDVPLDLRVAEAMLAMRSRS